MIHVCNIIQHNTTMAHSNISCVGDQLLENFPPLHVLLVTVTVVCNAEKVTSMVPTPIYVDNLTLVHAFATHRLIKETFTDSFMQKLLP